MEKLIGPREAAEALGVKLSTIYAWTYRRRLPCLKVGARLRFSPSALTRWLKERERPALRPLHGAPAAPAEEGGER